MKVKVLFLVALGSIIVAGVYTFKLESIEEIRTLTGSSRRNQRYFSRFSTQLRYTISWIEMTLQANGEEVPSPRLAAHDG